MSNISAISWREQVAQDEMEDYILFVFFSLLICFMNLIIILYFLFSKTESCIVHRHIFTYLEYIPFYACIIPKLNLFLDDIVNINISKLFYVFMQSSRHIFNKELNIYIS